MTASGDDIFVFILILAIAFCYYFARNELTRSRNERIFSINERPFRPSSQIRNHKTTQQTDEIFKDHPIPQTCVEGEIRISRANHWRESDYAPIKSSEWLDFIENHDELQTISELNPFPAKWKGDDRSEGTIFEWDNGSIKVKNPPQKVFEKMSTIAAILNATIQNENGDRLDNHGRLLDQHLL